MGLMSTCITLGILKVSMRKARQTPVKTTAKETLKVSVVDGIQYLIKTMLMLTAMMKTLGF
jgi:hypothetical protein